MANGSLSGWVMVRPVRLGLLVAADGNDLARAAQCATSSWGGIYTPFLDPADGDGALRRADALSVDAIYAAADDPAVRDITSMPGYQWVNRSPFGPYDEPNEYRPSRLLAGTRSSARSAMIASWSTIVGRLPIRWPCCSLSGSGNMAPQISSAR